jgi:iron complex transport system ATP-binding protein
MERPAIRLRGVGCTIDGRALLKDIEWDIEPGSRWVVFGSNGCGKTTLLSIIAGYGSYSGSVKIGDAELNTMDELDWRTSIGFVSGSFFGRIYQNETVLSILAAGARGTMGAPLEEVTPQEMRAIRKLLASRGLAHRLDSPFVTLSKGEQQVVLVLRAMLLKTQTLLLDEPMSGLDVAARAEMQHMLFALADKRQATMIYVSHHLEEISPELFDNCLLLSRGRVQASGPIREVLSSPAALRIIGDNPYAQKGADEQ